MEAHLQVKGAELQEVRKVEKCNLVLREADFNVKSGSHQGRDKDAVVP